MLAGCATRPPEDRGEGACFPDFRYEDGWLGGDAAYAVALPGAPADERRTLMTTMQAYDRLGRECWAGVLVPRQKPTHGPADVQAEWLRATAS